MKMIGKTLGSSTTNYLAIAVLFLTLSLSATPSTADEVIKLKAQSWGGGTYSPRIMMESVLDKLRASGRFKIDYFPGEPLMSAKEAFDGMREGVLDIAISGAGYHLDRMGLVGAVQWMPRNFDFEKFGENYRKPGNFFDFSQRYFEKMGLRLLSDQHTPPAALYSTKPVQSLEDMKGLLLRDTGAMGEWQKLLGAASVRMASSEVYEGYQRGVLEGNIGSIDAYVSHKWYEVAPHLSLIDWFLGGMQLMMNLKVYNSLTPELKAMLDQTILEAERKMWKAAQADENKIIEDVKAKGVKVYKLPKEELARWESAIKPYYDSLEKTYGAEWNDFMKIRESLK